MLPQGIRQAILELHARGHSVRAIARALQVSRAAVRAVLRRGSAEVPRLVRPEKALDHREEILRLLRECEGSFMRVHEELTKAGLALSYPAFTAFCRRHGIGQVPTPPVGRYDFAPGQEMQHDTSPHDVHLGGTVRRVQTASLVLGYSRLLFFQFCSIHGSAASSARSSSPRPFAISTASVRPASSTIPTWSCSRAPAAT
jgi:transposase